MFETIKEIILGYVSVPEESITPETSILTDLGLSREEMPGLAADLDDEYGVELSLRDLATINTMQDLMDLLTDMEQR